MIRKVSSFFAIATLACTFGSAAAQTSPKLQKQIDRFDLGISGVGELTPSQTGTVLPLKAPNAGQPLTDDTSNTLGALINLRYIAKPYVGFEFNYTYARYTENFCCTAQTGGGNLGVQTRADEYTLGYIATPNHPIFTLQPFASVGLGSIGFKPTPRGGESLPEQARAAYYYSVGLQDDLSPHFGLRVSFRQVFYLDPDFGQNYLTILKHTITSEPTAGFYFRF